MNINKTLISLLRFAVCGGEFDKNLIDGLDEETLKKIYCLANKHDMAHIVSKALADLGVSLTSQIGAKFVEKQMMAVYRYERSKHELSAICGALENNKIMYLPLKGSVIRDYYPEPWMRTSCDIDILVQKSDIDMAVKCLEEDLKYVYKEKSPHDVSLYSPSGIHLELHHRLIENKDSESFEKTLAKVFDYTEHANGFNYKLNMTQDMFYYFHIAHMAKHFTSGGCGIKPLLDLWVLEHRADYKFDVARKLLEKGGLFKFAESIRKLMHTWFLGEEETEVSRQLEEYILTGGVYGCSVNRMSVTQSKRRGKFKYILRKIFLPYSTIKLYYTVLEKHKWLLPLCELHRWLRLIFCGGIDKSIREIKTTNSVSDEQIENAGSLLENIGL